jgi:hypothetical protein
VTLSYKEIAQKVSLDALDILCELFQWQAEKSFGAKA